MAAPGVHLFFTVSGNLRDANLTAAWLTEEREEEEHTSQRRVVVV